MHNANSYRPTTTYIVHYPQLAPIKYSICLFLITITIIIIIHHHHRHHVHGVPHQSHTDKY